MGDLKNLTNSTSMKQISISLHKIYNKIYENRKKNVSEHNIKEIDLMKNYCKTDNLQLNLMCCHTFVKLVENGSLDLEKILNFFLTLITNLSFGQYTILTESIINLLLLDLKRNLAQLKPNEKYKCPYVLKNLQHPLIAIIQNNEVNINDFASKITGIYNHRDKEIRLHSIEFLRPVCFYIFYNPQIPDLKTIWMTLLTQSETRDDADHLIQEIITWSKINSPSACSSTSILIIETIKHYQKLNKIKQSNELVIYLCLITNHLIEYGIDPRPSLNCILSTLNENLNENDNNNDRYLCNIILVILSKSLHIICPIYISDLLRICELIILKKNFGNKYILNMILDGIILWIGQTTFQPLDGVQLGNEIIKKIIKINNRNYNNTIKNDDNDEKQNKENPAEECNEHEYDNENEFISDIRNLHLDIALAFDITKLSENFDKSEFKNVFIFIDSFDIKTKKNFCNHIQLFIRALFLSNDSSLDCWFKIYQIILSIIRSNELITYDFLMTYVYKLSNETHPEIQLELLRGLPFFATSKNCIPVVLNMIKTLSNGKLTTFCLDLYLKLFKIENRTYTFLHQLLMLNDSSDEFNLAKAYTVREICLARPSHYGTDLVPIISNLLNKNVNMYDDLMVSMALDAITILCENNIINIASTWKVISGKFRHERRIKSLQSLYKFFGTVAMLESPSKEYYRLLDEAIEHLWTVVATSDHSKLIRSALKELSNYDIDTKMLLNHIPSKFRHHNESDDIIGSSPQSKGNSSDVEQEEIPGYVWVLLLKRIKPECIEAAADLISHYISEEISSYRSHVYFMLEGKPEPRIYGQLYDKSVLKAIVDYLLSKARYADKINQTQALVITNALRAISKKFPKPMPPLDWSFLQSFYHISFLTRKYCILIAQNQMVNSGTAKRFIENLLIGFEPNIFEEDLLLIFDILPNLANNVNSNILITFIDKISTYCYKESQLNGFQEGCLFEKFLDSIKAVYMNKCESPQALDSLNVFNLTIEKYMDLIDLDTKLFQKYTELVASLDLQTINKLTLPSNWPEIKIDKLKKATLIRCYLVLYNNIQTYNPLNWLNPIINAFSIMDSKEQIFFYRHLSFTLCAFNDDKIEWIMEWIINELMGQIQSLLIDLNKNDQNNSNINTNKMKFLFLLDIFVLSVILLSGCAILIGNLNYVATMKIQRMKIFPESIQILCEHSYWKNNESKIYEFLYSMFKNSILPDDYGKVFKNAIICSRNKQYFDRNMWKYIGMRK